MSLEAETINAICKNKDISAAFSDNIDDFFTAYGDVWDGLKSYYAKYRVVPDASVLAEKFQDFEVIETNEPAPAYVDKLRNTFLERKIRSIVLENSGDLTASSATRVLDKLQTEFSTLSKYSATIKDVDVTDIEDSERYYRELKIRADAMGGSQGIPTGFDIIDKSYHTHMAGGHLIVMIGWPGKMKSWFSERVAINAWLAGFRPMIVSMEMNAEAMRDRIYTLMGEGQFSMSGLSRGDIDIDDFRTYGKKMVDGKTGFIIVSPEGVADMTPNVIQTKIDKYRPDLLVCHERGTRIFTEGEWMNVEDHPTAQESTRQGVEVSVRGVPFSEVVTPEHRYWSMVRRGGRDWINGRSVYNHERLSTAPGWVEAADLTSNHFIGYPIDMTEIPVSGYMDDPEFWWMTGYWWGDGSVNQNSIEFSVADGDTDSLDRLKKYAENLGRSWSIKQLQGCVKIRFTHSSMARWFKSWHQGNSIKTPVGFETIPLRYQKELLDGYMQADGHGGHTITSINLDGLLILRQISARLGTPASIRKGAAPGHRTFPNGITSPTKQSYSIRFGTSGNHYSESFVFIRDGYLWSKVREVSSTEGERTFIPIQTESHEYITAFGLSHNCDYHQLMMDNKKTTATTERNMNLSRELKLLAVRNNIPVIDIVSATANDASDRNDPPLLSQVAWSKQIEYDADMAVAVHKADDISNPAIVEVVSRKMRHGNDFAMFLSWDVNRGIIETKFDL